MINVSFEVFFLPFLFSFSFCFKEQVPSPAPQQSITEILALFFFFALIPYLKPTVPTCLCTHRLSNLDGSPLTVKDRLVS